MFYKLATYALLLGCLASAAAHADNIGNVTVQGKGACSAITGTFALKADQVPTSQANTIVFRLSLLANISGLQQPQYIVDTINQVGGASSGTAQVFNNGFLGTAGSFFTGTWSGTFPTFNAFAVLQFGPLTITTGTGTTACILTFTNGEAVF